MMEPEHYIQYIQSVLTFLGVLGLVPILYYFFRLSVAMDRTLELLKELKNEVIWSRDRSTKEHEALLDAFQEAQREMRVEHKELLDRSLLFGERLERKRGREE